MSLESSHWGTFQVTQHGHNYTLPPALAKAKKGLDRAKKEQILNTALLNPSAWDQRQKPDEVCGDLRDFQHQLARQSLTQAAGVPHENGGREQKVKR